MNEDYMSQVTLGTGGRRGGGGAWLYFKFEYKVICINFSMCKAAMLGRH